MNPSPGVIPISNDNRDAIEVLLARVALGDIAAFRALHTRCSSKLRPYAMRFMRLEELADDVLQESFMSIWREAGQFDATRAGPMTWMSTIVKRKAIDALRYHSVRERFIGWRVDEQCANIDDILDPGFDPSEVVARQRQRHRINVALEKLVTSQREAIELAFFHDLSHAEVAREMSLPLGTIKTCIRRGRIKLRKDLLMEQ